MKVSKIPGLGRFGIFIDDVDFEHMSDDQWMEIGRLHLENQSVGSGVGFDYSRA
jgi:hypothetical protein